VHARADGGDAGGQEGADRLPDRPAGKHAKLEGIAGYHFTDDDLSGRTEIGKSVDLGRKHARQDARRPAEFCDRMEEVLSLWRSNVLPSPQ
jgi:hypothetical protein